MIGAFQLNLDFANSSIFAALNQYCKTTHGFGVYDYDTDQPELHGAYELITYNKVSDSSFSYQDETIHKIADRLLFYRKLVTTSKSLEVKGFLVRINRIERKLQPLFLMGTKIKEDDV